MRQSRLSGHQSPDRWLREHRNNQSYQKLIDILEEQDKYEEANSYREKLKAFEKLGISDING